MSRAAHAQGASRRLELLGLDAASKPELAEWRSTGTAELAGGVAGVLSEGRNSQAKNAP